VGSTLGFPPRGGRIWGKGLTSASLHNFYVSDRRSSAGPREDRVSEYFFTILITSSKPPTQVQRLLPTTAWLAVLPVFLLLAQHAALTRGICTSSFRTTGLNPTLSGFVPVFS
jgi:hypothetical protein